MTEQRAPYGDEQVDPGPRETDAQRLQATPWPPALPAGTLVWCPDCDARRRPVIEESDATHVDLLCGTCSVILATFYRPE